jgi:hypothetical protein
MRAKALLLATVYKRFTVGKQRRYYRHHENRILDVAAVQAVNMPFHFNGRKSDSDVRQPKSTHFGNNKYAMRRHMHEIKQNLYIFCKLCHAKLGASKNRI